MPTPEHERDEAMPSDLGKKSFLKNLNQIFQKILKNPSCCGAFCGSTKLVATGRTTKVATLVYRLVGGLLPGDVIMKEEMIKVLHLPQWQQTLLLLRESIGEFLLF